MPRVCTICTNPRRDEIDEAVSLRQLSYRDIAARYGVTKASLARHTDAGHVSEKLALAKEAADAASADSLLDQVRRLVADAKRIQLTAETAKDSRTALQAIREQARVLELLARLVGELETGTRINVLQVNGSQPRELTADELEHELALGAELLAELRAAQSQPAPAVVTVSGHALPLSPAEGAKP